jgi:hypothetical protein
MKERAFFEDKESGELMYLLGIAKVQNHTDCVFQMSLGQRVLSPKLMEERLRLVDPTDQRYQFASVENRLFYENSMEETSAAPCQ